MTTKQLDAENETDLQREESVRRALEFHSSAFGPFVLSSGLRLPPCDADLSAGKFRNGWDRAFNRQPEHDQKPTPEPLFEDLMRDAVALDVSDPEKTYLLFVDARTVDEGALAGCVTGSDVTAIFVIPHGEATVAECVAAGDYDRIVIPEVLAERERCARIAEAVVQSSGDYVFSRGWKIAQGAIAAKIRSGE